MRSLPSVPGVYFEPRPREPEAPFVRTDVAGFVGFEPRVTDGTGRSRLTGGSPPTGHQFLIDVLEFDLEVDGARRRVPAATDLALSADAASIPILDGQSIVYSLAAVETGQAGLILVAAAGPPAATGSERAATDDQLRAAAGALSDGTTPSTLTGGPPATGHEFRVDVRTLHVGVGSVAVEVPATQDVTLSSDAASIPMADGASRAYALVATTEPGGTLRLIGVPGDAAPSGREQPPGFQGVGSAVRAAVGNRPWGRIGEVTIARDGDTVAVQVPDKRWMRIADLRFARAGSVLRTTVIPRLPPSRLDDWRDYARALGTPRTDGPYLAAAVRAFFANGGRRCHVATVRRPDFRDTAGLSKARAEMVGIRGASERDATGLERLLLIDEVSIVDVPDLYAGRLETTTTDFDLPGTTEDTRFRDCSELDRPASGQARGEAAELEPFYDDDQVFETQKLLLLRTIDERWRTLLLLNVPLELRPSDGLYHGPTVQKAQLWRQRLASLGEGPEAMSCAALYFPWVLGQERVDAPVHELPPTFFAAGVIARRDLSRGAHVSPANETVRGVAGLTQPLDDRVGGELYEPPSNINVLRTFAGFGVQVWGARTLSSGKWLRYLAVRRCLSAIERRAVAALQPLVFEPNSPLLWLQISQLMVAILLPIFESGALRGSRPEESFYIRCDSSVNPPEEVEAGRVLCEVGVAIAAPAEFIIFRVGRREGIVEVME